MNKKSILTSMLLIAATSLFAGNITQKQADDIVLNYVKSEALKPAALYNYGKTPDGEGVGIKTSNDEEFRAKYACWAYCLEESEPAQRRYLFVKEEGGSLLEAGACGRARRAPRTAGSRPVRRGRPSSCRPYRP